MLLGGTLARYADAGCELVVLSATGGDQGIPGGDSSRDAMGIRARELHAAARVLGVRGVVVLDYSPAGLAGLEPDVLTDLFFDVMRAVEPDVVISVGGDSIDSEPDRAAVHAATNEAFFRARGLPVSAGSLPDKLYFCVWPAQHERRAMRVLQAQGVASSAIPSPSLPPWGGSPGGSRPPTASAARVSTIIDVRATLPRKVEAVRRHESDLDPAFAGLAPAVLEDLWGQEFFVRAFPHPWITGVIERDLLAGLAPVTRAWPVAS